LFSVNRGNRYFENVIHQDQSNKLLASSCVQDSKTADVILKLVNASAEATTMTVDLKSFKRINPNATLTVLSGDKDAENTSKEKNLVLPVSSNFKATTIFDYKLPAYSVAVIRIKTKK
jgi:alpha-L-arabinofuranosidase